MFNAISRSSAATSPFHQPDFCRGTGDNAPTVTPPAQPDGIDLLRGGPNPIFCKKADEPPMTITVTCDPDDTPIVSVEGNTVTVTCHGYEKLPD